MAKFLNFECESVSFLCFDHPIVINMMAMILISGCSKEVNRNSAFFICPKTAFPSGDTNQSIIPTKNWMCVKIKAKSASFLSFPMNSFLEEKPINAFITAIKRNANTR